MSAAPAIQTNTPAEPSNVSSRVLSQVQKLQERHALFLPGNYSVENALKSAWFSIQNSDQKEKILACSPESQTNALFDMVLQGMDVAKKQGYFIPYGTRLLFQRSYFGDIALAQRVRPGIHIFHDVIYEGEKVTPYKETTRYGYITKVRHEPAFPRKANAVIIGAYCGVIDENGEEMGVELMDIEQIKKSWRKSKTYNATSATFHNEQPDVACQRTVIRRRLKPIINSSNDAALLESIRRQDEDAVDAEFAEDVAANANKQPLSLEGGQVIQMPQVPPQQAEAKAEVATEEAPAEDRQPAKHKQSEPADEEMDF